jgi:hypothetical protein
MFFKSTLTVPKIKDLVNSPNQKYQNIYDTISHKSTSYTDIDLLPINDSTDMTMKNELKSFLKKQLNNDSDTNTNTNTNTVMGLDTLSGDKFSNF